MKSERLSIYGDRFPNGFASVFRAVRVARERLAGLPQSYFPRAPKDGEHLIRVQVDPNGVAHERGDILLDLAIQSSNFPGLHGDWEIVQAKATYTTSHDGETSGWFRYLLVRPADSGEAATARQAMERKNQQVMDQMMES